MYSSSSPKILTRSHQPPNISNKLKLPIPPHTIPPPTYERQMIRTAKMRFINDHYVAPVIIEFDSSDSDNSVDIFMKHRKLFVAPKILDPSNSIIINNTASIILENSRWGRNSQKRFKLLQIRNHNSSALSFIMNFIRKS